MSILFGDFPASHVWSREAPKGLSIFVMVIWRIFRHYCSFLLVSQWVIRSYPLGNIDVWFLVAFVAFPTILNWNTHEYHMNIMNTHGECLGNPRCSYLRHGGFSMSKQAQRRVAEQQREAVKRTDRAPDKARWNSAGGWWAYGCFRLYPHIWYIYK